MRRTFVFGLLLLTNVAFGHPHEGFESLKEEIHFVRKKLNELRHIENKLTDRFADRVDSAKDDVSSVESDARDVQEILECADKVIPIYQKNLPYTIKGPGVYCLAEDAEYCPENAGGAAITIQAGPVVLDLNSHTLSQKDYASFTSGVLVDGQNAVTIKNGTIQNFTQNAIQVGPKSSEVFIDAIFATGNGVSNAPDGFLQNFAGGLFLKDSIDIQVQNSHFDQNVGQFAGIGITGCTNVIIDNVSCNNNSGAQPFVNAPFTVVAGIGICGPEVPPFEFASTNIWIKNSECNQNQASEVSAGIQNRSVTGQTNLIIEDCVCNENFSGNTVMGFDMENADNILLNRCTASGNSASLSGFGFMLWGVRACIIEDSISFDNAGASQSYGYFMFEGSRLFLLNSAAQINSATNFGIGYFCSMNDSLIDSCKVQGYNQYGFYTDMYNSTMQNCFVENNSLAVYVIGAGSIFQNNLLVKNSFAGFFHFGSDNLFISNVARSNGPGGGLNYFGNNFPADICPVACAPSPGVTPLRHWFLPNSLCPVNTNCVAGDPLDNISISP